MNRLPEERLATLVVGLRAAEEEVERLRSARAMMARGEWDRDTAAFAAAEMWSSYAAALKDAADMALAEYEDSTAAFRLGSGTT